MVLAKSHEFLFGLALFPTSRRLADDEEVRRVQDAQPFPLRDPVLKFNGRRLILILQHHSIVLEFADARQLILMALELNRDAHLAARITS